MWDIYKAGVCTKCDPKYCNSVFIPCNKSTGICDVNKSEIVNNNYICDFNSDITIIYSDYDYIYYKVYTYKMDVKIAESKTPTLINSWKTIHDFNDDNIKAPATLFIKSENELYLLYNYGNNIGIKMSSSAQSWPTNNFDCILLYSRNNSNYFDRDGVEVGTQPIMINNEYYLLIYNGYILNNNTKYYSIGYVIIDQNNKIIKRSQESLIKPTNNWEKGTYPYNCINNCSVYAKTITQIPSKYHI